MHRSSPEHDAFEMRFRLSTVSAGSWVTVLICVGGGIYSALFAAPSDRLAMLALLACAILSAPLALWVIPWPRIVRSRHRELAFFTWTCLNFALIAAVALIDGGGHSPMALAFFIPVVFAALSYPRASVVGVAVVAELAYVGVAVASPTDTGFALVFCTMLLGTALMAVWQAANHEGWRAQISAVASTDALTGCLNRRGFARAAQAAFSRLARGGEPVSLLLFDLDHFKAYNDTHGHQAGDERLRWVGRQLQAGVRPSDAVARFGGDEFAVLLPEADQCAAGAVIARIEELLGDGAPHCLGRATAPAHGRTFDDLYRAADADLYRRKAVRTQETLADPVAEVFARRKRDSGLSAAQILEGITEAYYALDAEWRFVYLNGPAELLLGRPGHELLGRCVWEEFPEAQTSLIHEVYMRVAETRLAESFEVFYAPLDNWFTVKAGPVGDGVGVYFHEITARVRAEQEARLRAQLLEEVDAAVITVDPDGLIESWNAGAERIYGLSAEEAVGRDVLLLTEDTGAFHDRIGAALMRDGRWEGEFDGRRADGSMFPAYLRLVARHAVGDAPAGFIGVSMDVSDRVREARELGAAQRHLRAVTDSMAEGLMTVDAGGVLTYLNATADRMLGHEAGVLAGRPLADAVGSGEHVARALTAAQPVRVEHDRFRCADGTTLPVSYTATPLAVGGQPAGAVVVFSNESDREAKLVEMREELDGVHWLNRIRHALEHDRLVLHSQPIVEIATGQVVQHELLIRMLAEDGTLLFPGDFLPVAERYGVITEVDRWVIRQAVQRIASGMPCHVNVSARSVGDADLPRYVERELDAAGARSDLLVFELTETALLADERSAIAFIDRVRALGCRVAIDDFGGGYAGFRYLKSLPVDILKIDMDFVRDLEVNEASRQVVKAVASMAEGLGLVTVAEGVERPETLRRLAALGVSCAQGYLLGRPAPMAELSVTARPGAGSAAALVTTPS